MNRPLKIWLPTAAVVILTMACFAAGLPIQEVEGNVIPFTPERWDLANAKVVDHLERKAMMGAALLKDVEFEDGIIECDIAMKAGVRSYPGIIFRLQSMEDYERVYLRPHRSPLYDDAVQYIPAFHGVTVGRSITARALPQEP